MMEAKRQEILSGAFCSVLEELAFMFAEPLEKNEAEAPSGVGFLVAMCFDGPFRGSLSLAVPAEMSPELAANILGIEPDDPAVSSGALDALKELLNVVCGNLLTALAGVEPVFDLTVPEARELKDDGWAELKIDPDAIAFNVDEHIVLLRLIIEDVGAA